MEKTVEEKLIEDLLTAGRMQEAGILSDIIVEYDRSGKNSAKELLLILMDKIKEDLIQTTHLGTV